MIEFLKESVNYVNLPATTLMIMVLLYWLMIIIGVFGFDAIDLDFDADVDVDISPEIDGGAVSTAPSTSFGGNTTTGNEGFLRSVFEYFYLGEVPIVIVISFLALYFWMATLATNHYFNVDQNLIPSLLWMIPNTIGTLVLTRYSMIPFAIIFRKPPDEDKKREDMLGLVGVVTTSEVTEKFGQMELEKENGVEITLNIRTRPGVKLGKGEAAKIMSFDYNAGTFLVELTKWEKK